MIILLTARALQDSRQVESDTDQRLLEKLEGLLWQWNMSNNICASNIGRATDQNFFDLQRDGDLARRRGLLVVGFVGRFLCVYIVQ